MNPLDSAYAAGVIDSDGAITLCVCRRPQVTFGYVFALKVSVVMVTKEVPMWMHEKFGGCFSKSKPGATNLKDRYTWIVQAKQAVKFLKPILPHLKLKAPQARLGLQFQELKSSGGYRKQNPKPLRAYKMEASLVEKMRMLNTKSNKPRGNQVDLSTLFQRYDSCSI